jgi:hypothetical protein
MGGLGLTARGYSLLTKKLMDLAQECSHQRIISILEGGYADNAYEPATFVGLSQCAMAHVCTLVTGQLQDETPFFAATGRHNRHSGIKKDFPVIVKGEIRFENRSSDTGSLRVTDLNGAVVYRTKVPAGTASLPLSPYCPKSKLIVEVVFKNGGRTVIPWENF